MNELNSLRIPIAEVARPRSAPVTVEDVAAIESLGLSAALGDYPLTVRRMAELIAELRQRVEKLERRK